MRIFSGIQADGREALRQLHRRASASTWRRRSEGDAFFCIVDLHSITVDYDPRDLHEPHARPGGAALRDRARPGPLDVFVQSHVTAHAEAAWLLSAVTSFGQLGRMTQFKEKGERQEFVSAGLFTYPVLMAGDILLYQTDIVPIGDDQRQHLELARDVAERFNARFGETFKVPRGRLPRGRARGSWTCRSRAKKMSTTGGTPQGTVLVLDPPDVDPQEVQDRGHRLGPRGPPRPDEKPGVSNLIEILVGRDRRADPGDRVALRRPGLRRSSRPTSARRSSSCFGRSRSATPSCAPTRRELAAAARGRRGQGARGVGADARADVRAHGVRPAVEPAPQCHRTRGASRSATGADSR